MTPAENAPAWCSTGHFVTVDAETDLIVEGIRTIAEIRDQVEKEVHAEIPIVWFVRFQRTWDEYVTIDSPSYFSGPFADGFDGFELAKPELRRLRERGDEIGWHYHAYSYVHRDDLSHARKIAILQADLASCGAEIQRRHGEFDVRSLRFGWFFIPDYDLFTTLRAAGIRADASVDPRLSGQKVAVFDSTYLPPITSSPREVNGIWFFPFKRTTLTHDYEVRSHDFEWSRQDEEQALQSRRQLDATLHAEARRLKEAGGRFLTYERICPANGS